MKKTGFTLMELFIVVAIIVVLTVIIVLAINPAKMLMKSRDSGRNNDMAALSTAIDLYLADNKDFKGLSGSYLSNTNTASSAKKNDGTGWMPIKLNTISSGAPLATLPLDPINNDTYYYSFGVNSIAKTYEINCIFELPVNIQKESTDGGNNINAYEVGTDLTLLP